MAHVISAVFVCLLGVGLYLLKWLLDSQHSHHLPPGPSWWSLVRCMLEISFEKNPEIFTALGKKYGEISTINMLGTRYVVLNSSKAISEILEKQSSKCSNRPHLTMASDLAGFGNGLVFTDYHDRHRKYRKNFYRLFGSKNSTAMFHPIEEEETHSFLRNVFRNPDDLVRHVRTTTGAIILKVTYGYIVQEENDPFVELAESTMSTLSMLASPGAFLVDTIPALRYLPEWFPGMSFLQDAKKYQQTWNESVRRPYQYVVDQVTTGKAIPSFVSTLLEDAVSDDEEDIIMWTSASVYLGAADTIVSAIHAFFLAMVLSPEAQAKAQTELDAVVGCERLPSFNDRDSLPYINAVWKEVLRWHVVAPLAVTHVSTEDIYFNGFLVPKGSHIIGNSWAILNDEVTYPDPWVFRPERFLGEKPQPDPQTVCFGFGRRICPGESIAHTYDVPSFATFLGYHLAEASLFITVAMSLAVFNISKAIVDGVEVTPEVKGTSGIISHPKPFKCQITPRSARAEALLRD